ncbi:MAG: DNA polymerase I [Rhodospirillales bacterium]|nr:DNA polymerase I [Rhodospirillales bacterium]MDP6773431.1 DNA polymerase I [Rhodospirillales bacterium]
MNASKPDHVYLIDGSGFIFRAFHALPPMTRPDGTPVNAVFGFIKMLMKVVEDMDAEYVAVILDKGRRTFRNEIYPDYKANRPPPPDELIPQFALVRDATQALNVACVEMAGFEADDLIATFARRAREAGKEVTIVSSDKDLMQLVGPGVVMWDAMKNRAIGPDQVVEKFGVGPDRVVDVQALAGDSSDNVPGVAGIGVKTAALLINEYGDLDTVLARAGEIKQPKRRQSLLDEAEMARVSRHLVTLKDDVPIEEPLDAFAVREPEPAALLAFLEEQGFKSLVAKVRSHAVAAGDGGVSPALETPEPAPVETAYELVQTAPALERWIADAFRDGIVAVDTETTSLNAMRADLVGVSLSVAAGRACYIPLGHAAPAAQGALDLGDGGTGGTGGKGGGKKPKQIAMKTALKALKSLLESPYVLKVGHNIKYDMKVLARHGVKVAPIDDTMVLSYVLEGGLHGHGLDELAELHLAHATIKFKDVAGSGKAQVTFDQVPLEAARDYAAEDADITGRLYRLLKPRLAPEHMVTVYETLERPLMPVLEAMERTGIRVDAGALKALSADFTQRLADLEGEIHGLAGRQFNVGSPKQLGEVLFDEMGLEGGKKGKTGAYVTGADVLDDLAAQGHDLPARVLDWRQLAKLKSTYADALVQEINPDTGRVHTSYAQAVAATGRLSSSDPNLQNIPVRTEEGRKIRRAFVAEKGWRFLSADYSQIELRLLAHVAGIEALVEAFLGGLDIHAMTASQVFGVPVEGMDPMVRRQAKAINFGIIYGISAFGLARQLGISRTEAGEYIEAYFERYPGIQDYMERTKQEARAKGFVTTPFGRKCHVRGINERNPARRNFAERAAINAPLQGGAADIIKRAMVRLPGALEAAGLEARMLLQVHDELIFEVPKAQTDATAAVVSDVMGSAAHLRVPLVVDTGFGDNWDEAH